MAAAYAITDEDYEKTAAEQAQKYLKSVLDRASTAERKAVCKAVSNFNVADDLVQAAEEETCDMIFIVSHVSSGLPRLFCGTAPCQGDRKRVMEGKREC